MIKSGPTISLCMIVRDEERFLRQAIASVQPVGSQVIVVDTGSEDQTVEIALSLGAQVIRFPWQDDFAAARNESLKHAQGDWILVLDADEAIDQRDLPALRALIKKKDACFIFRHRHYLDQITIQGFTPCTGEYPDWERGQQGYFEDQRCRLFPNHRGIYYVGKVHELIEPRLAELNWKQVLPAPFPVHHYGYLDSILSKKKKGQLYTRLGEVKAEQQASQKSDYELAVQYAQEQRYSESRKYFQRVIESNPKFVSAWINLGNVCLEMGLQEESFNAYNQALALDHVNTEAHFNLAVALYRRSQPFLAEAHFKKTLELKPNHIQAICGLAKLYETQGLKAQAVELLQRSHRDFPAVLLLPLSLAELHCTLGHIDEAEKLLKKVECTGKELARTLFLRSRIDWVQGDLNRALERLHACRIEIEGKRPIDNAFLQCVDTNIKACLQKLQPDGQV